MTPLPLPQSRGMLPRWALTGLAAGLLAATAGGEARADAAMALDKGLGDKHGNPETDILRPAFRGCSVVAKTPGQSRTPASSAIRCDRNGSAPDWVTYLFAHKYRGIVTVVCSRYSRKGAARRQARSLQ